MGKALSVTGTHESKHIKLGVGRIFIGSQSATFDGTTKFNSLTIPSGWEDLGDLGQDVTLNNTTELFKFANGTPALVKRSYVTGREATLQATFNEYKARIIQIAIGLSNPINKVTGSTTVSASPTPTSTVFTVASASSFAVGDEIIVETVAGDCATSTNTGLISAIATNAITLRQALPKGAPTTGDTVKKRTSAKLVIGGGSVPTYPLLFVVDFQLDNKQFVMFFPKVSSQGTFNPAFGNAKENAKIGVTWDLYGVTDSDFGDSVLAAAYIFEDETAGSS
jgi:hypothetical protein